MLINTCSVYKTEHHIHEGMHLCRLCFYSVWVHIIESKMVNQKQNEDEFFHIHNIYMYTTYIQRMNYYQNQLLDTWKCVSLGVPLSNLFFFLFDSIFNTKNVRACVRRTIMIVTRHFMTLDLDLFNFETKSLFDTSIQN